MLPRIKNVDRSISSVAAFRLQQDELAVRLCRKPDALYRKQRSNPALTRKLRDWGVFAAEIRGEMCMVQEPPYWLRTPAYLHDDSNDYVLVRKPGTANAENALDPEPTLDFFEDPNRIKELLVWADQKTRGTFGGRVLLSGSSVNPSAPLFSKREPYFFGDIDVFVPYFSQESNPPVQLTEGINLVNRPNLKIGNTRHSVAVEAKFWLLTRGDAPLNERHCGPSFGVSDNGDFVPYKSYYREGRWRWVAGAPLKYYRYLSDKFGVFKDGQSEDMGSI